MRLIVSFFLSGAKVTMRFFSGISPSTETSAIHPSLLSTVRSSSFRLEYGAMQPSRPAPCALRMRVRRSPMGSFTGDTGGKSREKSRKREDLPGGLCDAGNQAFAGKLAETDAADAEEAHVAMATVAERTAIVDARGEFRLLALGLLFEILGKACALAEDEGFACHNKRLGNLSASWRTFGRRFERHTDKFQESHRFSVVSGSRGKLDLHAEDFGGLRGRGLRGNGMILETDSGVTLAVEARGEAAEVADARKGGAQEAVDEFLHPFATQRDFRADHKALAGLEVGDGDARLGVDRLEAGNDAEALADVRMQLFAVHLGLVDTHVHDHFFDAGQCMNIGDLELFFERFADGTAEAVMERCVLARRSFSGGCR